MDATEPGGHGVEAEPDRVSTRTVVGFAILLTVVSIASMAFVAALFQRLEARADKRDAASVAAAGLERRPAQRPPLPRLQVYPVRHWKDFQSAEAERLSTYGWMDRSTGAVHIPVERAMDLIAERGVGPLPAAPVAMPAPQATPGPAPAPPEGKK